MHTTLIEALHVSHQGFAMMSMLAVIMVFYCVAVFSIKPGRAISQEKMQEMVDDYFLQRALRDSTVSSKEESSPYPLPDVYF